MEQNSFQGYVDQIAEALTHIENNRELAWKDLKEGESYETLEYLKKLTPERQAQDTAIRAAWAEHRKGD